MGAPAAALHLQEVSAGGDVTITVGAERVTLRQIETHYLAGVYAECNRIKLIVDEAPDERYQPRLQRIYVDLYTCEAPALRLLARRLGLPQVNETQLLNQLRRALPEEVRPAPAPAAPREFGVQWRDALLRLNDEQMAEAAKALGVAAALRPALANQSVLEVAQEVPRFVLLGDPGGGKSTLTQRLAGVLASSVRRRDELEEAWLAELAAVFGRWLLPVRIVLSRWAKELAANSTGVADDLIDGCVRLIHETAGLEGLKSDFVERLQGQVPSVLLLLDGLDEVTDEGKRSLLCKAIGHFLTCYPEVPLIVTCRTRPWRAWSEAGKPLPLPVYKLDHLNEAAIGDFLQRWHDELVWARIYEPATATAARWRLLDAIHDARRAELADMAGTPLLLTMMARVNYKKGLPGSRAALYEEYVNELLWEWEKHKKNDLGEESSLQSLLRDFDVREEGSLNRALSRLAWEVHDRRRHDQDTVDIPRSELRSAFERICPGGEEQKARFALRLLNLLDERSGLINCLDNRAAENRIYQFSHRTFQEYLAARWMTQENYLAKFRSRIDQENWREAVFLALGYQISVREEYHNALTVFDELLSDEEEHAAAPAVPNLQSQIANLKSTWWRRVLLLGDAYVRLLGEQKASEVEERSLARRVTQRVPALLTAALQNAGLPASQRLEAGLLLADLPIEPPGLDEFVTTPNWPFQIARYPVTNGQYRRFVEAGGYAPKNEKRWWSKEGQHYKKEYEWTAPRLWDDPTFNRTTQPVVGVSWYEAQAYCAWLTHTLRTAGQLTDQEEVRLPTAAQWEQAARSHDGRPYPWGKTFVAAHANTQESGLQQTTPVHMYPQGATPEGICDLCGNVWEWIEDDESFGKGLRGGAYWNDAQNVGSAARQWYRPRRRGVRYGFRCVVVPISRSSF